MGSDGTLEQLQRDVQYLKDRLAIQDVVMRHCRGVDRHDVKLMNRCYHPDGVARYGPAIIQASDYGEWSNSAHAGGRFKLHSHSITTLNVTDLEGDIAYCESYVIGSFLSPDQTRGSMVVGRYFDQLEKRNGEWKIAVRRTQIDICIEGDASFLGAFRAAEVNEEDFWSERDISYKRPLDVETEVPGWH